MKGKSLTKKTNVNATPIVVIDESQQLTSTVVVSKILNNQSSSIKPSSNVFAGGFKYRPQEQKNVAASKQSKISNNFSKFNPSKIDKVTVYDEFGIINDSIGKKKYRQQSKQPQKNNQFDSSINSYSTSNPWKKQSKDKMTNNFIDPSYYEISKLKQRQQSAIHVKSSLEVINLQNIQAKLQAHRQSLRPLEQQYNNLKGKSSIQPQYKQKLRFNVNIDKQYNEMQPQKIYQFIKDAQQKMERPKQDIIMEDLWEQKKKNDPKLAEYDFKYQQYLVEKQAKKMIGSVVKDSIFTWDKYATKEEIQKRKIAKQHKSKQKSYGQAVQSKVIQKSYKKPVQISPQQFEKQQQQGKQVKIQQKIASKDDKFIGKYIMAQIDVDKKGMISKDQLVDYLMGNDHLIKGYHIDLKWLHTDLDNYDTKRKGMLTQNQLIQFLATLNALHHPEIVLKEITKEKKKQTTFLFEKDKQKGKIYTSFFSENASKFEKVFAMLDLSDDRIIKREQFIENIFIDAQCNKIIDKNVIVFHVIDKSITFRHILTFILEDYRKQRNEKLKKSKEYITIQRFNQYFQVPQSLDLTLIDRNHNDKLKKQKSSNQIQLFDIDEQYLLILKDIFDTIPRIYQNYIVVNDFINIAMKDPQVLAISDELCRIQSVQTKIPVETIKSTLLRMRKQCDQYGTWDIIKTYFTRRGRPLDWDLELIQKKKQIRQQKFNQNASVVKNISNLRQQELSSSKPLFELSSKLNNIKNSSPQKYTIPKPFNITDEIKKKQASAKKLSSQEMEIEELKKKFKAKPLNAQILQPKPDLIQGKLGKSLQKSNVYNYENYQNDRIQRLLKKAQEQLEQQERLKQIKRLTEVKAKQVKIDLNKKLDDVIKQQKRAKDKTKPKPTVPQANPNLYPENPKEQAKKKLEKYKVKLQKQEQAIQIKEGLQKQIKQRAKGRNQQIKQAAKEKKKREEEQKDQLAKLNANSFKPVINKRNTTEQEKQALKKAKQQRQRKKMEEQEAIMQLVQKKKKEKLSYVKQETKLQIESLQDEEIFNRIEQIDLQDILIDEQDKASFRKEFQLKDKTRKEIKQRFNGQAARQRAAMQAQEKRLAQQKREFKQKKQQKVIKQKIEQAKQIKKEAAPNIEPNFHRSNALRRYRALIQGKQPKSQYDDYSRAGDNEKNDI